MNSDDMDTDVTMAGGAQRALLAGRYRVVKQLGQGGMGSVWLAEDTQLDGKLFAIKMLPSILVSNKRAYRQLKDEALVAMKLVHPNIVQLRAFEENNGNPFLVMDYVDGQTLDDYLADRLVGRVVPNAPRRLEDKPPYQAQSGLPEDEVVRILKPIAAALDYAHSKGVVHRDVKPANIMLAKDGTPFILDFGISREMQETMTRVTGKLSSGTLLYMSPEQLHGAPPKKEQDIYSFAAMAYECMSGHPPFCRGQIEFQIDKDMPEPLVGRDDPIAPQSIANSIMSGLAKRPEERPATCAGVLAVKDVNRAEHVERADSGGTRLSRPQRSHAVAKFLGVLALLVALAGGAYYGWTKYSEGVRAKDAEIERIRQETAARLEAERKANEERMAKLEAENKSEEELSKAEADVTNIAVDADVWENRIKRISDANGFAVRKGALSDMLVRARSYSRLKDWSAAFPAFTNYVEGCKKLETLDADRNAAVSSCGVAETAKAAAKVSGAEQYAEVRWNAANRLLGEGHDKMVEMQFAAAREKFALAEKQYTIAAEEAPVERKKAEDKKLEEARKAAAERERRKNWRVEGQEFTISSSANSYLDMKMKWCPKGSFMMGSPTTEVVRLYWKGSNSSDRMMDMEVQHKVILTKGFWMGETEVTQGQWKKLMNGETVLDLATKALQDDTLYQLGGKKQTLRDFWRLTKYSDPQSRCGDIKDDVPVYYVSWNEAVEFCRRLTAKERSEGRIPDGYEYRLPTEAEWEYACRAGTTAALSNGRDSRKLGECNAPALDDIAWYAGNSSVGFDGRGWDTNNWLEKQYSGGRAAPREVKGKRGNEWGLYDMTGNVCEWCGDWAYGYKHDTVTDPTVSESGEVRIYRGGSWKGDCSYCRSAARDFDLPSFRSETLGFRVALAPSH